jgi:ArsR family transcriptional regulator, arsenate/arsenite/antimonite-responsive transcriptional repressor
MMPNAIFVKANMSKPCCAPKPAPRLRQLDTLTAVYGALADATRLRILALLADGEVCVCHIHASLGVPQPTASRHLAYLRRIGLVTARRSGIWMHYSLAPLDNPVAATVVASALHALTHADQTSHDHERLRRTIAASA